MRAFSSNKSGFCFALTLVLCALVFVDAQAQVRAAFTIQGVVTDDEGSPLPNVTLKVPDPVTVIRSVAKPTKLNATVTAASALVNSKT